MPTFPNFFETSEEARMRLRRTIVKYKDDFYHIMEVSNHRQDGKFRVYMEPLGRSYVGRDANPLLPEISVYGEPSINGQILDEYLDSMSGRPESEVGVIRKYASSKHFNKFRPFPLGNVNTKGGVIHCERSPTRNMHQGLLSEAVVSTRVSITPSTYDPFKCGYPSDQEAEHPVHNIDIKVYSPEFLSMLKGEYPSLTEVLTNLRDPDILNSGCAFHKDWSIMRGPAGTLFLCYKSSGVGQVFTGSVFGNSVSSVNLSREFEFLKEELEESGWFNTVNIAKDYYK
jgi:hypothetical protein